MLARAWNSTKAGKTIANRSRDPIRRPCHLMLQGLRLDVVVLQLLVERRAIDLEDRGGLRLVAVRRRERGEDAFLLEVAQRARDGRARTGAVRRGDGDGAP